MKASLKFRDEQQPLVKAKVPVSILGLPFLSGITAGETKELRLDLATAFESGPSLRICYRPNDTRKPFSFILKTGAGSLGSPNSASMTMSAEFSLFGRGSPMFTVQIKPQIGDFCLRRSSTSVAGTFPPIFSNEANNDLTSSVGFFSNKLNGTSSSSGGIYNLLSGVELTSQSILPIRNKAELKVRWGARIPSKIKPTFIDFAERESPFYEISRCKLPLLVMSKISIEQKGARISDHKPDDLSVQKQVDALRIQTATIRNTLEELRAEVRSSKRSLSHAAAAEKSPPPPPPPEPARR